jgi:hypothetical protein
MNERVVRVFVCLTFGALAGACTTVEVYPGEPGATADAGPGGGGLVCGSNTHEVNGVCEGCPTGTATDADGVCRPYAQPGDGGYACGPGTHEVGGLCVPDGADGGLVCGPGTHAAGGACVPDPTHGADGGLVCGPGTHEEAGACVRNDLEGYELRAVTTEIPADGHSKYPLLAIGTRADGSPATDMIVLGVTRLGAGSFTDATLTLEPLGTTTYFVPCDGLDVGCLGPVTVVMALASAPTVPVASVNLELVMPMGVGSAAPCLTGGNVMFFDGHDDWVYDGMLTVTQATWGASGGTSTLGIHLTPAGMSQGLWWDLDFNTTRLGVPLAPGVYEDAERAAFASPDHPGIDVSGDGRGCNTIRGRFEVHDYELVNGRVKNATVSFEQHCEGGTNVLNGCVHYEE